MMNREKVMSKCDCSMSISVLGDGCRYCQPQEYIDRLHDTIEDEREEQSASSSHDELLARMIEIAPCPNSGCDGGVIPRCIGEGEWEPEQCQWCYEKTKFLTNYREATK
jgi:hypothetical protein